MGSIVTKLALYGNKNECARTDNVFSPISEVCNGTVSLSYQLPTEMVPMSNTTEPIKYRLQNNFRIKKPYPVTVLPYNESAILNKRSFTTT